MYLHYTNRMATSKWDQGLEITISSLYFRGGAWEWLCSKLVIFKKWWGCCQVSFVICVLNKMGSVLCCWMGRVILGPISQLWHQKVVNQHTWKALSSFYPPAKPFCTGSPASLLLSPPTSGVTSTPTSSGHGWSFPEQCQLSFLCSFLRNRFDPMIPDVLQKHPKVRSRITECFPRPKQDKGVVGNMIVHDPCAPPHLFHGGFIFK